ncbi:MAG: TolC family protein [Synechocystis sp.]
MLSILRQWIKILGGSLGGLSLISLGGLANEPSSVTPATAPPTLDTQDLLKMPADPLALPTSIDQVTDQAAIAITLTEAIELAQTNNRTLQIVKQQLAQAEFNVRSAESRYLPNLSVTSNLNSAVYSLDVLEQKFYNQLYSSVGLDYNQTQTNVPVFNQETQQLSFYSISPLDSPINTFDTTLTLSYLVYGGEGRAGNLRSAQEKLKIQQLQVTLQELTLFQQTRSAYYDIQQAQAQIKISQENLSNAKISFNDADALRQAGFATIADVLQAQVQVKNAEQQLAQAQGDLISAQSNLTQILSLSDGMIVTAADEIRLETAWPYSLEKSLLLAYENRPELQQQLAQRQIAQAEQDIALSSVRPQLQLIAQTDLNKALNSGAGYPEGIDANWGLGYSLTAQMRWDFFDGGNAIAQKQSAQASEQIADTQFANLHNLPRITPICKLPLKIIIRRRKQLI